jgi:hypothetical protein
MREVSAIAIRYSRENVFAVAGSCEGDLAIRGKSLPIEYLSFVSGVPSL